MFVPDFMQTAPMLAAEFENVTVSPLAFTVSSALEHAPSLPEPTPRARCSDGAKMPAAAAARPPAAKSTEDTNQAGRQEWGKQGSTVVWLRSTEAKLRRTYEG